MLYFSTEEFSLFLGEAGFRIKELFPYGVEGSCPGSTQSSPVSGDPEFAP